MAFVTFGYDYGEESGRALISLAEEDFFEEEDVNEGSVEESGKRKIMSVELALQRECAYARKVAKLQLDHHNERDKSSVLRQASPLNPKLGVNRTPPSENLPSLSVAPPEGQQCYDKPTPETQPQLRQPYTKQTVQIQPPDNLSHLPTPQLQKAKHALQIQSPCIQPPQLQKAKQALQIHSSRNLSCAPPPQLQKAKQTLQIQSSGNVAYIPPPHPHQSSSKKNVQIKPSENLSCTPSYTRHAVQTRLSENLSCAPAPQLQQSYTRPTLQIQASQNLLCLPPTYANHRSFQLQPLSLVCKQCQVACSSAFTLKQHYRGKKHRARVQELKLQRSIQTPAIQNVVNNPLWCDICRIRCMNEDCYWEHLNGKKHASCVQAINAARGEPGQNSFMG